MPGLCVGVGVRDITPAPGLPLWGYSNRLGPATGTLDPLYAKTVAFRVGEMIVAWVVLDLGRVPMPGDCDEIRRRVSDTGVRHVVFHATHTHHAPTMELIEGDPRKTLLAGIEASIREAVSNLTLARLGFVHAEIDIAHNRRKLTKDGRCFMVWRNEARVPTSPVDKIATVIKFDSEDGKPLAVLVHYACHPVVMDASNLEYSGDYVGTLTRIVSGMTDAPCIFLQGACGDINPYLDKTPLEEGGIDSAFTTGRIAAEAILAALHGIRMESAEHPSLGFAETMVKVGTRWDFNDESQRELIRGIQSRLFDRYMKNLTPDLSVPVCALIVNNELALVGMPGEYYVQFQIELKRIALVRHSLICGYVNDYQAYFPPIAHAAAGGYGGTMASFVGVGAAERMFAESQILLFRLLGRITPTCSLEDFVIHDQGPIPD